MKYWPEIGKCGFLVWRYLLRRDDVEPAPWTSEGMERSKKLGLSVQVRIKAGRAGIFFSVQANAIQKWKSVKLKPHFSCTSLVGSYTKNKNKKITSKLERSLKN